MAGIVYTGTYHNGILLNNPTVQSTAIVTGYVGNTGSSHKGDAIYGAVGTPWSVVNDGAIVANPTLSSVGIDLRSGGSITNNETGSVAGQYAGIRIAGGPGTVTNLGTLSGDGSGVELKDGGSVTNGTSGLISGNVGVYVVGGAANIVNSGSITSIYVAGNAAVTLTNAGTVGLVTLGGGDDRVIIQPGAVFSGSVDGGGGKDEVDFSNPGSQSIAGFRGFETVKLADGGANALALTNNNFSGGTQHTITVVGGNDGNTIDAGSVSLGSVAVTEVGGAGADTLTGGAGDDTLKGGGGADTMTGGAGDDTSVVDNSGDVVKENAGEGRDTVKTSLADYTLGPNVENLTYTGTVAFSGTGNTLNNTISGGAGNDALKGGGGNDALDGGKGADTMIGGAGDDTYFVDNAGDVISENAGGGNDTVKTSLLSYSLGATVENLSFIGTGAFTGTGNALDNTIIGGAGKDTLKGGGGNDTLNGGAGADTMTGGSGNDTYFVDNTDDAVSENAGAGIDTVKTTLESYALGANVEKLIFIGSGNFTGIGNGLANVMIGGGGNDTLNGGAGADAMTGGGGNDTYFVNSAGDAVNENAGGGIDTVRTSLHSYTLGTNVENLSFIGSGNFVGSGTSSANVMTGGGGNDTLHGGDGNDTLDGGAGADAMSGGAGNDYFYVDNLGDAVSENAGEGVDTVKVTLPIYTLPSNVENLIYIGNGSLFGVGNGLNNVITSGAGDDTLSGGGGNDTLNAGAGYDTLDGGGGNDRLDGGSGADAMSGGTGNDVYIVDNSGDSVSENGGEGTDTVRTSLPLYELGDNVENLVYTGKANFNGTGNDLNNIVSGGPGNDVLRGGDGDDTLNGGAGNDVLYGGAGGDPKHEDMLNGGDGNDTLDGGSGWNHLFGGAGNDTFIIRDLVQDTAEDYEGINTIKTTTLTFDLTPDQDTIGDFQNLTFIGSGDYTGIGNNFDNVIIGGSGNDTLSGGAGNDTLMGGGGADTMSGGAGDDTFYVGDFGDVVKENAGAGTDTVKTTLPIYALPANVENVTYIGNGTFFGSGNALGNTIIGGAGDDTLSGNAGNDTLNGKGGADHMAGGANNDTYVVDNTGDVVSENAGEGTDTVETTLASYTLPANVENLTFIGSGSFTGTGNALNNRITGDGSADTLHGGGGNDVLDGRFGNDLLTGGAGQDRFLFDTALNAAKNVDHITDFSSIDDRIQLSDLIFGAAGAPGTLAAEAFHIGNAAADAGDRIIYNSATGALSYDPDGTGTAHATQFATLSAHLNLSNTNFQIV